MANEVAKAYVQIEPTAKGIKGAITKQLGGEAASAGKSSGALIGANLVGALTGAIAAAGIGSAIKAALDEGAKLQQSYGGLDTIYGEASEAAKQYAVEASKAGISANDYAEQAVSFGASLKQAFEGDTTKAVEAANTAIMDMTDNAAKMGTPIESIQNAYQGFAKQNYTMLDNLKLGYGGTKEEMERLLADAEKLSGQEYDISNLGDVYDAIHVIQEDLGLTGVAAQEASETFSGSFGAMKAAAANFLGALSTGQDVAPALTTLIGNVGTFISGNLFPMVMNILTALPTVVMTAVPMLIQAVQNIISQIATFLTTSAPPLGISAITGMITGIGQQLPAMMEQGILILTNIVNGILSAIPQIASAAGEIFSSLINTGMTMLPQVLSLGIEAILNLANGIIQNLPAITGATLEAFSTILNTFLDNAPKLLESGIQLIAQLVQGILQSLPNLAASALQIIVQIVTTIGENLPKILETGGELIGKLLTGIVEAVPKLIGEIPGIITQIRDAFMEYDWLSIGTNIIEGIKDGILGAAGKIADAAKEAAKSALNAAKNFLGISSPSKVFRDQVGEMMAEGMAIGFEDNVPTAEIQTALKPMASVVPEALGGSQYSYGGFTINVYGAPGQDVNELADIIGDRINAQINRGRAVFA